MIQRSGAEGPTVEWACESTYRADLAKLAALYAGNREAGERAFEALDARAEEALPVDLAQLDALLDDGHPTEAWENAEASMETAAVDAYARQCATWRLRSRLRRRHGMNARTRRTLRERVTLERGRNVWNRRDLAATATRTGRRGHNRRPAGARPRGRRATTRTASRGSPSGDSDEPAPPLGRRHNEVERWGR